MNELHVEIGARVKQARNLRGWTREQLSERLDISAQFLTEIEFGRRGMSLLTLTKMCKVLGVSADGLLFGRLAKEQGGVQQKLRDVQSELAEVQEMLAHLSE